MANVRESGSYPHGTWTAGPTSRISGPFTSGAMMCTRWEFERTSETRIENGISAVVSGQDWTRYSSLVIKIMPLRRLRGRLHCNVVSEGISCGLGEVSRMSIPERWTGTELISAQPEALTVNRWNDVELSLVHRELREVTKIALYWEGDKSEPETEAVLVGELSLEAKRRAPVHTVPVPQVEQRVTTGSSHADQKHRKVQRGVRARRAGGHSNPYAVFMCYPMWPVTGLNGKPLLGSSPDRRAHPEWQETLVADWAALGLSQLHFYMFPRRLTDGRRNYSLSTEDREGIHHFARLCAKYHIRVGLRVDAPSETPDAGDGTQDPVVDYWPAHPRNPRNELSQFFNWVIEIIELLGGAEYVILGDEIDSSRQTRPDGKHWAIEDFLAYVRHGATQIHARFPTVKVSGPAFGAGSWADIVAMLAGGYARVADAVAINNDNPDLAEKFIEELHRLSPEKEIALLSNGVGYVSCDTALRNPPTDVYRRYSDQEQGHHIARSMYSWWAANSTVAPYYVPIRSITYNGAPNPQWYGFFGFMDLHIDGDGTSSTIRYPAWHALRTITSIFSDRESIEPCALHVVSTNPQTRRLDVWIRNRNDLLLVLWTDSSDKTTTDIHIDSSDYTKPEMVNLFNHGMWTGIGTSQDGGGVSLRDVPLTSAPTVIRLTRRN